MIFDTIKLCLYLFRLGPCFLQLHYYPIQSLICIYLKKKRKATHEQYPWVFQTPNLSAYSTTYIQDKRGGKEVQTALLHFQRHYYYCLLGEDRTLGSINSMSIEGRRNMTSRIWFFFLMVKRGQVVKTSRQQQQKAQLTCSCLPLHWRLGRQTDSLDKSNWRPLPRHRDHTEQHHTLHRNKAVRSERRMGGLMGMMAGVVV